MTSKRKDKTELAYIDDKTFEKLKNLANDGAMNLDFDLVESLKNRKFENRKELKTYLRDRGFSHRQINAIVPKVYYNK